MINIIPGKTSKSVLQNINKSLMDDCSAAASFEEKSVNDGVGRVAEALINLDKTLVHSQ